LPLPAVKAVFKGDASVTDWPEASVILQNSHEPAAGPLIWTIMTSSRGNRPLVEPTMTDDCPPMVLAVTHVRALSA
jgi:hypothetical protein